MFYPSSSTKPTVFYLNVDIQISYRFKFWLEKILQHQGKFVGIEVCGTT